MQNRFDKDLEYWLVFGFHTRWGIDLNQPNTQVLIHHKVVAEKFKAVFAVVYHILNR